MRKYSLFPKTLARCVETLTKPVFKSRGLAGSRILTDWPEVVGSELGVHCWPEKISFPQGKKTGGTLTIIAENGFATELQHMQPTILERINVFYGYQAVTRLAISQRFVRAEPAKLKTKLVATRSGTPLTVVGIADGELKEALQSLANSLSGK